MNVPAAKCDSMSGDNKVLRPENEGQEPPPMLSYLRAEQQRQSLGNRKPREQLKVDSICERKHR